MKTLLITREGYNKLKKELDFLWREDRPEVTKKVTWAASLGDRSENAITNTIKSGCVRSIAGCVISPSALSS
ncbi:Transcript cleavage factor greB [Serratia fonticola]|uniref:Transcription elongation factor GreA n=1 Tax=Serratia fonticola TaxID=47917 RepID=A0A4U9WR62_SERFO|nr:Transcript cleavage factor greB [Serratia fonticola]